MVIPHLCVCCVLLSREKVWCLLPKLVNKSSSPLLPQSAEPLRSDSHWTAISPSMLLNPTTVCFAEYSIQLFSMRPGCFIVSPNFSFQYYKSTVVNVDKELPCWPSAVYQTIVMSSCTDIRILSLLEIPNPSFSQGNYLKGNVYLWANVIVAVYFGCFKFID